KPRARGRELHRPPDHDAPPLVPGRANAPYRVDGDLPRAIPEQGVRVGTRRRGVHRVMSRLQNHLTIGPDARDDPNAPFLAVRELHGLTRRKGHHEFRTVVPVAANDGLATGKPPGGLVEADDLELRLSVRAPEDGDM